MKRLLLVLVLLYPMASMADFHEGLEAYIRGDFVTAIRLWRPLAEAGHAKAQNNLGVMYANGEGVPQDDVRAYAWGKLAEAHGDKNAPKGVCIMHEHITPAQLIEAEALFKKLCAAIPTCHGE